MTREPLVVALALLGASGVPGLFMRRSPAAGQRIAAAMTGLGAAVGLYGAAAGFFAPPVSGPFFFPWPSAGNPLLGADALSSFFLVPIFLVGALGSVYGLGYWSAAEHPSARKLQFFWGSMIAGMTLLTISRHSLAFLLGWEAMALSAFFLVSAEDEKTECRSAGYVFLVAAHVGTLTLFGLFAYWRHVAGSFDLAPIPSGAADPAALGVIFLLALFGFGLKAGIMPLHFWLPGAHSNAPSHVSAILSGVLLKTGVYGVLRFSFLLPDPPAAWGAAVLALGVASGLLGVAFALGQHDLKRLLAYHSVENIGIIFMGLGLSLLGRSAGRTDWVVLGTAGCLLHVWNHSFFKSLLFMGAGSVLRASGTRNIDELGGLGKRMPWTAALFLVGAVAICGLPPLNGFASELLIYLGLLSPLTAASHPFASAAAVCVPALAMIGALALACFVKAYGSVFLGADRNGKAAGAREAPASMIVPMALLSAFCLAIGLFPSAVAPILDRVIAEQLHRPLPPVAAAAPLGTAGAASAVLLALLCASAAAALFAARRTRRTPTWDCGYARPTSRMQYTASSFARSIVGLFAWTLRPRGREPKIEGVFPGTAALESHVDEVVLDRILTPFARAAERRSEWFHRFQRGLTQHYIAYIMAILVLLLLPLIPYKELARYLISLR